MAMQAVVAALDYYLPEAVLTTEALASERPDWGVEKIDAKTGITERHIAAPEQCSSDLAVEAGRKLFDSGVCRPEDIDFVILCTETPDHLLPPTACIVQHRLGIPKTSGAFSFDLGSSGYVYGLGLAQGLIATEQASRILLLTSDVYSRLLHPMDRSVRTLFADAATATLITGLDRHEPAIGPFLYGSDGSGANNLIVPAGGMRQPRDSQTSVAEEDEFGNVRSPENLFMNGGEIFNFTINVVPPMVKGLLQKAQLAIEDIDLFVFHQANRYILEHLRKSMKVPAERFQISITCGNTVSSTIPIALKRAAIERSLPDGARIMLVGFGVGYSWGATILRWTPDLH